MSDLLIPFAIFWIVGGVFGYGFQYNYYQSNWPRIAEETESKDFRNALTQAVVFGPISLLVEWLSGNSKYGLRFRRYTYVNGIRQV